MENMNNKIINISSMGSKKRPLTTTTMKETKEVRFADEDEILPTTGIASDEITTSVRWYKRFDLALFKRDVHNYVMGKFDENKLEDDSPRGLERYGKERSRRKHTALDTILFAVKNDDMTPDEIALLAKAYSSKHQKQAFIIGCKDYCEVYRPDLLKTMFSSSSSSSSCKKKENESSSYCSMTTKRCFNDLSNNNENHVHHNHVRRVRYKFC